MVWLKISVLVTTNMSEMSPGLLEHLVHIASLKLRQYISDQTVAVRYTSTLQKGSLYYCILNDLIATYCTLTTSSVCMIHLLRCCQIWASLQFECITCLCYDYLCLYWPLWQSENVMGVTSEVTYGMVGAYSSLMSHFASRRQAKITGGLTTDHFRFIGTQELNGL